MQRYQQGILEFVVLLLCEGSRPNKTLRTICGPWARVTYSQCKIISPSFMGLQSFFFYPVFHYLSTKFVWNLFKCYCDREETCSFMWHHLVFLYFFSYSNRSALSEPSSPTRATTRLCWCCSISRTLSTRRSRHFWKVWRHQWLTLGDRTRAFKAFLLLTTYHKTGNVAYC